MKVDLHDHSLEEAKEKLCYSLEECHILRDSTLEIIHGYKHGTAIRQYVRSEKFLNDIGNLGNFFSSKNFNDKGKSIFQVKLPKINKYEKDSRSVSKLTKDYICHKCNKPMIPVEGP